jgi:hypothetical protein
VSGFDSSREQEVRAVRREQSAQARETQALRDRDRKMVAAALADTERGPERVVWRGRSWFVAVGQDDGDHAHLTLTHPLTHPDPREPVPEATDG